MELGLCLIRRKPIRCQTPRISGHRLSKTAIAVHGHCELQNVCGAWHAEKMTLALAGKVIAAIRGIDVAIVLFRKRVALRGDLRFSLAFRKREVLGRVAAHLLDELAAFPEHAIRGGVIQPAEVLVVNAVRTDDKAAGDQAANIFCGHGGSVLEPEPAIVLESAAIEDVTD